RSRPSRQARGADDHRSVPQGHRRAPTPHPAQDVVGQGAAERHARALSERPPRSAGHPCQRCRRASARPGGPFRALRAGPAAVVADAARIRLPRSTPVTRVLFSTIHEPEPLLARWAATDQMAYRLTRGQGLFTLEEHAHSWPLHILAQNVEADSVMLEWPSFEEFEAELANGEYQYVAISFMNRDVDKLVEMSRAVRRLQPRARIVIGGYGGICPSARQAGDQLDGADRVSRSGGVRVLRAPPLRP